MGKRRRKSEPKRPREAEVIPDVLPPEQYLNRDLSWLEFNRRVLNEAADERNPLLERVNFLSIFSSNLDEFVMKRVGLLKRHVLAGIQTKRAGGLTAAEVLQAIRQKVVRLQAEQGDVYVSRVLPALAQRGYVILRTEDLTAEEVQETRDYFRASVFPVLTPLAVDTGHPFPFISNLSNSLAIALKHPDREEKQFARVKVPRVLPQFIELKARGAAAEHRLLSLMDLVRLNLDELFPGMLILDVMPFRITRNADVEADLDDVDDTEDLVDVVEEELRLRKFEKVVRLEHPPAPAPWLLAYLTEQLELAPDDVYEVPGLLDYTRLKPIAEMPIRELRFEPWTPLPPRALADESSDIFATLRRGDVLVHHPYESFGASVERFVRTASQDPDVLAIKIALYRTGDDSPFIDSLIRAAESGKQVVALVELKARFDEERNIYLAQALERAGVHVVYGLVGLKTHTKTALVVRREADGLRCYAHVGTGNYHVQTAKLYTDLGILTSRSDLTEDLVDLFHFLTGRSLKRDYRKLLVAPVNMAERFLRMIEREIENKLAGKPARIVAKMNSLEEQNICKSLYRASQAGIPVDLVVRGICCLRPGVPGLSENIRVTSIIGRFLEHARLFHFAAGAASPTDGEFYLGSADWMYRNLFARVELMAPVEDAAARSRLWDLLQVELDDHRQAWELKPDGSYVQRTPPAGASGPRLLGTHAWLMQQTKRLAQTPAVERSEGPRPEAASPDAPRTGAPTSAPPAEQDAPRGAA